MSNHISQKAGNMKVTRSDFLKVLDALERAGAFFVRRDEMNAELHLSADRVRLSPLTSEVLAAKDRLAALLNEQKDEPHD